MSADDPSNTPDAAKSEWTIAAKPQAGQQVSYTTSWNADGTGADVYA
jgi:non-lysosomal glucosylceramidase